MTGDRIVMNKDIAVTVGYPNPRDDSLLEWFTVWMSRPEAARALRNARKRRLRIERSVAGYEVTGQTHPTWRYAQ